MYALLIKPAALKKRRNRRLLSELISNGAITLSGHDFQSIKAEVSSLAANQEHLTVVACGGDGTVHLALNAVVGTSVTFAVLPMGTGNDFARHYGLKNLRIAHEALRDLNKVSIDIGEITLSNSVTRFFGAVASCGFDANVNERANTMSGPNGPAKYLLAVIKELHSLSPLRLTVDLGHRRDEGFFSLIAIANTRSYGGGMKIAPSANSFDGDFSCTMVSKVKRRTLLRVLPTVFTGRHVFHPAVSVEQASEVTISGDFFRIYADGERVGSGPAKFTTRSASLQMLVPKDI